MIDQCPKNGEKAQGALETLLLEDNVDDDRQDDPSLAVKAQGALEALLLDEAAEEPQCPPEENQDLAVKAQAALETLLLNDDVDGDRQDEPSLTAKAQGTLERKPRALWRESSVLLDEAVEDVSQDLAEKAQGALESLLLDDNVDDDCQEDP